MGILATFWWVPRIFCPIPVDWLGENFAGKIPISEILPFPPYQLTEIDRKFTGPIKMWARIPVYYQLFIKISFNF